MAAASVPSVSVTLPAPLARTVGLSRTAAGDVVPSAAARARLRATDRDPVLAWVGTVAVTLLAAFLRFWELGKPRAFEFDETYYAKDAWSMMHFGYAQDYVEKANAADPGRPAPTGSGRATPTWSSTPSSASG